MKKYLALFLAMLMCLSLGSIAVSAEQGITVIVNGEAVVFADQQPIIVNGRTLIPVRGVFEALGVDSVNWIEAEQKVFIQWNKAEGVPGGVSENIQDFYSRFITLQINNPEIKYQKSLRVTTTTGDYGTIPEAPQILISDPPPQIINGRTMIPLRIALEAFGCDVDWNGDTQTVTVRSPVYRKDVFPEESHYKEIERLFFEKFGYLNEITYKVDTTNVYEDIFGNPTKFHSNFTRLTGTMPIKSKDALIDAEDYNSVPLGKYYAGWFTAVEECYAKVELFDRDILPDVVGIVQLNAERKWTSKHLITIQNAAFYSELAETNNPDGVTKLNKEIVRLRDEAISDIIKEGMSDMEKVRAVHDWIVLNCAYAKSELDYYNKYVGTTEFDPLKAYINDNASAYGVMLRNLAVCDGYSQTFDFFMSVLGIDVITVNGVVANKGENMRAHSWNLVKIDGEWYHVDCTWDDPDNDTMTQRINYNYFLISDVQMSELRNGEYFGGDDIFNTKYPECTSETRAGFKKYNL